MTQLTQDQRKQMLADRQGKKCPQCGARKPVGQAFCNGDFNTLPERMRPGLKSLFGKGYEPAYLAAREYLESIERQPSLI